MISSLATFQSLNNFSVIGAPAVTPFALTDRWTFQTLSGSNPTNVTNTIRTNNATYSGAATDAPAVANNSYFPLYLRTPHHLRMSGVTYTSNGCCITFRTKVVTARANTYSVIGHNNNVRCFNSTNGNMYLSYNTSGRGVTLFLISKGGGNRQIMAPVSGNTNWMFCSLIFGRDMETGTFDGTTWSYVQDYESSSNTFSSSNFSNTNSIILIKGLTLTAGQSISDTNNTGMFTSYVGTGSDNNQILMWVSDVRYYNYAPTRAQLTTIYDS